MPLQSGKSREAFSQNVATERTAGKPEKQALAIAYAKQRGDACPIESYMDDVRRGDSEAVARLLRNGK